MENYQYQKNFSLFRNFHVLSKQECGMGGKIVHLVQDDA